MNILLWTPHLLFLGVFVIVISFFWLFRFMRRGKRTPLTKQLLRMPGETLRQKIDDLEIDLNAYLLVTVSLPLLQYSMYLTASISNSVATFMKFFYVLSALAIILFFYCQDVEDKQREDDLRLALDCELAIYQELNQLMLNGCRVYHDFPAEQFNIDHVVVSPKGVLAFETKGRAKADKKRGISEATVIFNGEGLKFPGWYEKEPIEQAKRQAKWLSTWLSSAVGEAISVYPILVLPGWFIQRERPSDILIFNGKNPEMLLKWINGNSFSEAMIKRISHQIEQRCRDVEPIAYAKEKKK